MRPKWHNLAALLWLSAATATLGATPWMVPGAGAAEPDAGALYAEHCATCHGVGRLGGQGPALLPANLRRLRKSKAGKVISDGRAATQMPGFSEQLSRADIAALTAFVYQPLAQVPQWGAAEIEASRVFDAAAAALGDRPVFSADPLNLFVVVESGDHHVTILDGDRFEPIHRFQSRFALHGGPKFTPDGRFVYFASRDGWVTKFDIYNLVVVAEVRAGINTRNLAISADGRFLAVANYLPHTLVLLDATDLSLLRVIPAVDRSGKESSRVSAVYQARPRNSFIVALKDIPEIWEITTDENAPPVYTGFVHSYEKGMEEAIPAFQDLFARRRIVIKEPLDDFFFDQSYSHLFGSSRDGVH
ncbi:MAG: cytochrome D1 domain-containing protein, partial [Alphaproteobacteria bacterium]